MKTSDGAQLLYWYVSNNSLAKEFYRSVFDWVFKPMPAGYPEDKVAMFNYPDERFQHLSGGIVKSEKNTSSQTHEGNMVYLYVHDIEEMIEVSSFFQNRVQD